jgi:hypothetical protein
LGVGTFRICFIGRKVVPKQDDFSLTLRNPKLLLRCIIRKIMVAWHLNNNNTATISAMLVVKEGCINTFINWLEEEKGS